MARKITLIPGDGIGPEVTLAAKRCINATGVKIRMGGSNCRPVGPGKIRRALAGKCD